MTTTAHGTVVVLAKAPEAGVVKTRLCPPLQPAEAARLATAALEDTLDAVRLVPHVHRVLVLAGVLTEAPAGVELLPQRGTGLAARITAALADADSTGHQRPLLLIGMDTPQVTAGLLEDALDLLRDGANAVLGPAYDGGWWALGVRDPAYTQVLADVPMSTEETGRRTREALQGCGLEVRDLPMLRDVDTAADAIAVAAEAPGTRFAALARLLLVDGEASA